MKRHRYRYGESEIVGYEGAWRIEVYRPFEVHPREPWNAAITERVMCAGSSDESPRQSTEPGRGYDPDCSCCYLNITHTEGAHGARLTRKAAS